MRASKDSNEQRFLRAYRCALIGLPLAWRTILLVGLVLPEALHLLVAAVIVLYVWGLAPYLALAALAGRVGNRPLLLTSSALLFGGDVLSSMGVLRPGSSTDAVALLVYPLLASFGLIPVTLLVGWLLNR
jgi:hypothetical protein